MSMPLSYRFRRLRIESLESRRLLHAGSLAGDFGEGQGSGEQVADFHLVDTNSTSATAGEEVSPRDFLGQVSGWYFGHST